MMLAPAAVAGPLGDAASAMEPRTSVELATDLTADDLRPDTSYDAMTTYTDSAVWDPVRNQFKWLGAQASLRPYRNLIYDEASGDWSYGPLPPGMDVIGHGYDQNAMNAANGHHYYHRWDSSEIAKWDGSRWTLLPAYSQSRVSAGTSTYFPGLGLVITSAYGASYYDGNSWKRLAGEGALDIGTYHSISEYSPVHDVMIFGGGKSKGRNLYKLTPDKKITRIGNAPFDIGICGGDSACSIFTADPVTGNFIVLNKDGDSWWEYDPSTDDWNRLSGGMPGISGKGADRTTAAPISDHGVIMYIEGHSRPPKVWLYKHGAGGSSGGGSGTPPPEDPPPAPQARIMD